MLADAERALGLFFEPAVARVAGRAPRAAHARRAVLRLGPPAGDGRRAGVDAARAPARVPARPRHVPGDPGDHRGRLPRVAGRAAADGAGARVQRHAGGGLRRGGETLAHSVQSPYAAMPSGHVAFACVAAGTVFALVRSRALRSARCCTSRSSSWSSWHREPLLARRGRRALAAARRAGSTVRARTESIQPSRGCARRGSDDGDSRLDEALARRGDRRGPGRPGGGAAAAGRRASR